MYRYATGTAGGPFDGIITEIRFFIRIAVHRPIFLERTQRSNYQLAALTVASHTKYFIGKHKAIQNATP
jgi:hypothetical protein